MPKGELGLTRFGDLRAVQREVSLRVMQWIRDQYQVCEILFQRGPDESEKSKSQKRSPLTTEKRPIAKQGKRLCDPPAVSSGSASARVADRDAEAASIAERGFDHVTEMRVIDHDFANARARERLDPTRRSEICRALREALWGSRRSAASCARRVLRQESWL